MNIRSVRSILVASIVFLTAIGLSVWLIDRPLALFIHEEYTSGQLLSSTMSFIETVFGFSISKYLFGFIALLIGAALYLKDRKFTRANLFFFIACTHIVSRLGAGMLKNVFLRTRPYTFLESGADTPDFFANGNSFPSGHTAHFFGLFLPLLLLFPKQRWLLIIPVFVAVSRILANDHYLGDVLASVYISVLATWCFARIFSIGAYSFQRGRL